MIDAYLYEIRLSCRALMVIVIVRPNLHVNWASHQLNPALVNLTA